MKSWQKARLAASSIARARRARQAVGDVVGDRAGEDHAVLRDDADLPAEAAQRRVADVDAVDHDAAELRVEEAREQREQRRLARAVAADDGDALPLRDGERDVLDGGLLRVRVGEGDVFEGDVALDRRELDARGGSRLSAARESAALHRHVEDLEDARGGGVASLQDVVHLAHAPQRFADHRQRRPSR